MKISIGTFVLADSPASIPMVNLRINGERIVQEEALVGAEARIVFDRGNRQTTVTFDTTRLFGSPVEAETFLLMHETQFPGQGLVTFLSGTAGQNNYAAYLAGAVVKSVASSISGCTTRHRYHITGGVMTTSLS